MDRELNQHDRINAAEAEAMRDAIGRALRAADEPGKAGIAAAISLNGEIVATGENEVKLDPDPTRHAEMVAMTNAAAALGTSDLSNCVLISTLQPCEMCLSAMRFAGIKRLVFAARQRDVASKYFAFPHLRIEDFQDADKSSFEFIGGVQEADVRHLYAKVTE